MASEGKARKRRRVNSVKRYVSDVWEPKWGDASKWTMGFLRSNRWRCEYIHGVDDLMQDAYLIFVKVVEKYPRVTNIRHFMSLYRRALINSLHDKSRIKERANEIFEFFDTDARDVADQRIGSIDNDAYLRLLMDEAPEELKMLLEAYSNEEKLAVMRSPSIRFKDGTRESQNDKLSRILGLGRRVNLDLMLEYYLKP